MVASLTDEKVSWEDGYLGICGQRRPRSDCASAQSDQSLHCPLTSTLISAFYTAQKRRPGRDCAYALTKQYRRRRCSQLPVRTFSRDLAHICRCTYGPTLLKTGMRGVFAQSTSIPVPDAKKKNILCQTRMISQKSALTVFTVGWVPSKFAYSLFGPYIMYLYWKIWSVWTNTQTYLGLQYSTALRRHLFSRSFPNPVFIYHFCLQHE